MSLSYTSIIINISHCSLKSNKIRMRVNYLFNTLILCDLGSHRVVLFALCCSTLCPSGMVFWNDLCRYCRVKWCFIWTHHTIPTPGKTNRSNYTNSASVREQQCKTAKLKPTKLDVSYLKTGFLGATSKHPLAYDALVLPWLF